MNERINYEKEKDFITLISILSHKIKWMILIGIICALGASGIKYYTTGSAMYDETVTDSIPTKDYLGTAKIFLGKTNTMPLTELAKSYISGNELLQKVINDLKLNLKINELYNMIYLQNSTDTMLEINVVGQDETLVQEITDYLTNTGSANIRVKFNNTSISIIEPAYTVLREYNTEVKTVKQNYVNLIINLCKYLLVGFLLGVIMSIFYYWTIYIFDRSIMDCNDVEGYLGVPVLGSVSIIKNNRKLVERDKRKKKQRLSQYISR